MPSTEEQLQTLMATVRRLERRCQRQFWLLVVALVCLAATGALWNYFGWSMGRTIDPDPAEQLFQLAAEQHIRAREAANQQEVQFGWNSPTIVEEPSAYARREFLFQGRLEFNIFIYVGGNRRVVPAVVRYRYSKDRRGWELIDWYVSGAEESGKRDAIYAAMRAGFGKPGG